MPLKIGGPEIHRLLETLTDLNHYVAGNFTPGGHACQVSIRGGKSKRFAFLLVERASQLLLQLRLLARPDSFGAGQFLKIRRVKRFAQFLQIQADTVIRPVFRQHIAVTIQDAPAHRRDPHRSK